jgi:hypothetical protein
VAGGFIFGGLLGYLTSAQQLKPRNLAGSCLEINGRRFAHSDRELTVH